jgi:hypothetical protein
MDKSKWRAFISTLTTNELERHEEDILSFAKKCQQIISDELNERESSENLRNISVNTAFRSSPNNQIQYDDDEEVDDYDDYDDENIVSEMSDDEADTDGVELDFYTISRIQQTVPSMDEDELRERIEELDEILNGDLTEMDFAVATFEKEMCEYELAQITGEDEEIEENINCESCAASLQPTAIFCPKCGTRQ